MGPRSPKRDTAPIFSPCPLWPNGWMDQDATWYGGRPRPRPHCIRWGPSSPGKGRSCLCGFDHISTSGFGVGASRASFIAVSGRPLQVTVRPLLPDNLLSIISVLCSISNVGVLWPNGWMGQDATWYGGRPRPRRHCVRWGPSSPYEKGHSSPPPLVGPCLLWPNGRPSQQLLSSC